MSELIHVETERDGPVLIVRLAYESARNALTTEMRRSLQTVLRDIEEDRSIRSIYLCGKGESFCAGGDLNMLKVASAPWAVRRRFRHLNTVLLPLMTLDRPVVCGVQGYAVGGGMGLALTADVIVAAESAKFMAGFFRLGAVPDIMTMYTLPRLIGMARARNFLFGNQTMDAKQAHDLGLAMEVVPDAELHDRGLALARKLAEGPAEVMGLAKQIMLRTFENGLDDMYLYEELGQAMAMSSAEFKEGLGALVEKRKPDFVAAAAADPVSNGLPPSISPDTAKEGRSS
ncbi:enoyl-CoA hydratase [Pseudooceanicola nanhaiensis]|jgi:2-(1,2-epoxy-1,2-dihydrophenyl)acetyl-CoA isomerase|uniref:Enoyl-CoA hydratase n=1 Tax=Pseudooceanicola nanhaiensis TaxID=375761 RepID=A0A917WN89_9RHOB|nr:MULTISPECIES: enoyl-CoA hydratase/isomerase family protein [Rhodobacterales]GGM16669.1 enoyl-CoA hydratase [Pseudooceanicola nanhaiensis]